jgi:hypothetical protein
MSIDPLLLQLASNLLARLTVAGLAVQHDVAFDCRRCPPFTLARNEDRRKASRALSLMLRMFCREELAVSEEIEFIRSES